MNYNICDNNLNLRARFKKKIRDDEFIFFFKDWKQSRIIILIHDLELQKSDIPVPITMINRDNIFSNS